MKKSLIKIAISAGVVISALSISVAEAAQSITIGTFGDPNPMQWAAHEHKSVSSILAKFLSCGTVELR